MKEHKFQRRRIWAAWCSAIMIMVGLMLAPAKAQALSKPSNLESHYAYAVMDAYSGKIILSENLDRKVYIASTTKIMSAIVMLEQIEKDDSISLSDTVTITRDMMNHVEPDLVKYGLRAGEKYSLETLLNITLIPSAGDATYCAAIHTFGSVKKCVKAMNAKAKELGMDHSSFDNPTGLDIGNGYKNNYSTARDMATLTRYAMTNKIFASIVCKSTYQVRQTNGRLGNSINNTNRFLRGMYPTSLYKIIGTKTGTTEAAGKVLATTSIDSAGHKIICVYFGRSSTAARYTDTRKILNTVFSAVRSGDISLRTENTYAVNFKGNGADTGKMPFATMTFDKKSRLPKNAFSRDYYSFKGWNTKKNGKGEGYANEARVKNLIDRDEDSCTLYAQWKPKNYKILYDCDEMTDVLNVENPSRYNIESHVILTNPVRAGYSFQGWYTTPDYQKKTRITEIPAGSHGKLTLYSKWKKVKYFVEYMLNDSEDSAATPGDKTRYSFYVTTATWVPVPAQREGYLFLGWYLDAECTQPVTEIAQGTVGNLTLYALWEKIEPDEPVVDEPMTQDPATDEPAMNEEPALTDEPVSAESILEDADPILVEWN